MNLPDIDCAPPEAFPRTILDRVEGAPVTEGDLYDAHGRIDAEAAACQRSHAALAGRVDDELEELREDVAVWKGGAEEALRGHREVSSWVVDRLAVVGMLAVLALLGDVALAIALVVRT